jgi:preprotein translocase subunit SecA
VEFDPSDAEAEPAERILARWVREKFAIELPGEVVDSRDIDLIVQSTQAGYEKILADKRELFGDHFARILHYILLTSIDEKWKEHLREMDHLRAGIGMRGYAQVDPKLEYKKEGFQLFSDMLQSLKEEHCSLIPRIRMKIDEEQAQKELASTWKGGSAVSGQQVEHQFQSHGVRQEAGIASSKTGPAKPIVNEGPKVGRNDPCPCGSGKKYKNCHG